MANKELSALWVSGSLGYIEQLCLTSALDTGHSVILYTYEGCNNAPAGVDLRDGREIMPERFLVRYRAKGSYALASDFFRYFLLSKRDTCWTDVDMLFLRPRPDDNYIFGWQDHKSINGAILRMPSGSKILSDILAFSQSRTIIAPWWKPKKKVSQFVRSIVGRVKPIEKLEWGIIGPQAITCFAHSNNVAQRAAATEIYYPNHYSKAGDIFDPDVDFTQCITDRTISVHLWNEVIKRRVSLSPDRGSFLAQQCERLGITAPSTHRRY